MSAPQSHITSLEDTQRYNFDVNGFQMIRYQIRKPLTVKRNFNLVEQNSQNSVREPLIESFLH